MGLRPSEPVIPTLIPWQGQSSDRVAYRPDRSPTVKSATGEQYPLVNIQKAIENGHRNSEFSNGDPLHSYVSLPEGVPTAQARTREQWMTFSSSAGRLSRTMGKAYD